MPGPSNSTTPSSVYQRYQSCSPVPVVLLFHGTVDSFVTSTSSLKPYVDTGSSDGGAVTTAMA